MVSARLLTTPGAEEVVDTVDQTRILQELSPSPTNILSALAGTGSELDLTPHTAALLNVSSKIAGGGHTCYYRALSCSSDPRETFDAWLARKLYVNAPFDAIRLGVIPSISTPFQYDNMFLNEYGVAQPIFANPKEAFNGLFGSIGKGGGAQLPHGTTLVGLRQTGCVDALSAERVSEQAGNLPRSR